MTALTCEQVNRRFVEKTATAEGREKFSAAASAYVKDRLRESSFFEGILPIRNVSRTDRNVQRSVNHDTLVYFVEIESDSTALSMSFLSTPKSHYVRGYRMEVPFHRIGSKKYQIHENQLLAYDMDIMGQIRKNIVKDMEDVKDRISLVHSENATVAVQKYDAGIDIDATYADTESFTAFNVNAGTVNEIAKCKSADVLAGTVAANAAAGNNEVLSFPLQREDVVKLSKLFTGDGSERSGRLRMEKMLISDTDLADTITWSANEVGYKWADSATVDGVKSIKLAGYKFIRTLKTDILRPGNIYGFTSADFLGGQLRLNKIKFFTDKQRDKFSMECWEDLASYIANVASVRKLELYCGSAETLTTPANNVAVRARYAPIAESSIGRKNHLMDEGVVIPQVPTF